MEEEMNTMYTPEMAYQDYPRNHDGQESLILVILIIESYSFKSKLKLRRDITDLSLLEEVYIYPCFFLSLISISLKYNMPTRAIERSKQTQAQFQQLFIKKN